MSDSILSEVQKIKEGLMAQEANLQVAIKLAEQMRSQLDYYRIKYEACLKRTPYPEFCRHADKCANLRRCQADWVCND